MFPVMLLSVGLAAFVFAFLRAVSLTDVVTPPAEPNRKYVDVEATADADTTATIPHLLRTTPTKVWFVPLQLEAVLLSQWIVSTIDATNVVLTKETDAGSGAVGAQIRVYIESPHSSPG